MIVIGYCDPTYSNAIFLVRAVIVGGGLHQAAEFGFIEGLEEVFDEFHDTLSKFVESSAGKYHVGWAYSPW
jgi:hypothetical protein